MATDKSIVVVGGGLTGCLAACMLKFHGFNVTVYERWPDMRKATDLGGCYIYIYIYS